MAGLKLPNLSPAMMARLEETINTLRNLPARFPYTLKGNAAPLADSARELESLLGRYPQVQERALQLYHGSPHRFDKFDFEGNLLRGEGAMAFGPGGYMTGHRPLAEEYARNLTARANRPINVPQGPLGGSPWLSKMMKIDPEATLAYLQGKQLSTFDADSLVNGLPTLYSHYRKDPASGRYVTEWFEAPANHVNVEAFYDHANRAGVDLRQFLPSYNNASGRTYEGTQARPIRGPATMYEALKLGDKLAGAPSPLVQWDKAKAVHAGSGYGFPDGQSTQQMKQSVRQSNLRALAAAQAEVPGPKYTNGIGKNNTVDFNNWRDKLKNWDGNVEVHKPTVHEPSVYETTFDANPNQMFSYDGQLGDESPAVLGALSRVGGRFGVEVKPDMKGADFINTLHSKAGALNSIRALKEEGVPAMYFLRGGRRGSELSTTFEPSDYNFVIFDQDRINIDDVKNKRRGGAV